MPRPKQETARLRKRIEIRFGDGEPSNTGFSGNVSTAGIMVRSTKVYPPGKILTLQLKLPGGLVFRLEAVVIWSRTGSIQLLQTGRVGMGLMFVNPPEDLAEALRAWGAPTSLQAGV